MLDGIALLAFTMTRVAGPDFRPAETRSDLDARHFVVGIIASRRNQDLVSRLATGAHRAVAATGATPYVATAPGAFELPFAARVLIESGEVDCIVVLGVVIAGESGTGELVSGGCAQGIMQVQLSTGIPIGMGVLTVDNVAQALASSEGAGGHNVGEQATAAAIEMALMAEQARDPASDQHNR